MPRPTTIGLSARPLRLISLSALAIPMLAIARTGTSPAPDNFQRFDALSLKGSGHSLSQDDGHDLGRKGRYSKLAGGSRHRLNGDIENDAAMSLFVNYDLCEIGLHGGQLHIACSTNRTASTASTAPTTRRSAV